MKLFKGHTCNLLLRAPICIWACYSSSSGPAGEPDPLVDFTSLSTSFKISVFACYEI